MPKLDVPDHVKQLDWGYCLPACAEMTLAQLGIPKKQTDLASLLGTQAGIGTPFSRIKNLQDVTVEVLEWAGLPAISDALLMSKAVIAGILTTPRLPGWERIQTQHAILIIEITGTHIVYHDPAHTNVPASASIDEFLLAWSDMGEPIAFLQHNLL